MRNTEGVPWCLKMAEIDIPDPCFSLVPLPLLSRGTSRQETWVVVYACTATVHCVNTKTPPVFRPFSFTQPQRTAGLARQHRRVPYFVKGKRGKIIWFVFSFKFFWHFRPWHLSGCLRSHSHCALHEYQNTSSFPPIFIYPASEDCRAGQAT